MVTRIFGLVLLFAILGPVVAQAPPEPAEELKRLDPLLGHWKGEGVVHMEANDEGIRWTSRHHYRRVYGGHFVREDSRIHMAAPVDATLAFIVFYAWDAEQGRIETFGAGNNGTLQLGEMNFAEDGSMVSGSTMMEMGQRVVERWVMKPEGDSVHMKGERASGTGPFYVHVKGSMTRSKDEAPVEVEDLGPFMVQPSDEMKRLCRMAGHYTIKGRYAMGPGQELVEFEGTETLRSLFGGVALAFEPAGEGYSGWGVMSWDARKKRYVMFSVNSWGMAEHNECYWAPDGRFVATASGLFMGQPMISQTVIEVDAEGHPTKAQAHAMMAGSDPFLSFTGSYAPAER
jgi:hypothetical protein